jgi:hypothetical protein
MVEAMRDELPFRDSRTKEISDTLQVSRDTGSTTTLGLPFFLFLREREGELYLCTSVIWLGERRFSIWEVATNQQNSFETNEGISCRMAQTHCKLGISNFIPYSSGKVQQNPLFGIVIYIHRCSSYPVAFSHHFSLDIKDLPSAQNRAPENVQPPPAFSCYSLPVTLADSVALRLGLVDECRRSRVCVG